MKRFLAGCAFLVALGFAASASAVSVNFTGVSFDETPDPYINFSLLHDGPDENGDVRYLIPEGVAINYQWEIGTQARFGAGVTLCPLCGPSTFELIPHGSTTQNMTLTLFTAGGGGTNVLDVGVDVTTPASEPAPVPGGTVDLQAEIGGSINFILTAFEGSDVVETFNSHFVFDPTLLDTDPFNKFGTDSAGTGAIAIFLWGASAVGPTQQDNPLILAAFGGATCGPSGTAECGPLAIDIGFTGQIVPEPRTTAMFAVGLLMLAGLNLAARRRAGARSRRG